MCFAPDPGGSGHISCGWDLDPSKFWSWDPIPPPCWATGGPGVSRLKFGITMAPYSMEPIRCRQHRATFTNRSSWPVTRSSTLEQVDKPLCELKFVPAPGLGSCALEPWLRRFSTVNRRQGSLWRQPVGCGSAWCMATPASSTAAGVCVCRASARPTPQFFLFCI